MVGLYLALRSRTSASCLNLHTVRASLNNHKKRCNGSDADTLPAMISWGYLCDLEKQPGFQLDATRPMLDLMNRQAKTIAHEQRRLGKLL